MTPTVAELVFPVLFLFLLFAGLPNLARRLNRKHFLFRIRASHSLLLFSAIAFIPVFATVEMTGRYGIVTLIALMVFGIMDMLSPIILRPVQWFTNRHKISCMVDILVFRYRDRWFGQLITGALVLTALPIGIALMLASVDIVSFLLGVHGEPSMTVATVALVSFLLVCFAWQQENFSARSTATMLAMNAAALVILLCFIIVSLAVIYHVFGGIAPMNQWVSDNDNYAKLLRVENGPALVALFFCANIVLPQFYQLRASFRSEKTLGLTAWLFPLLLLVSSLPMMPLLWSGIELRAEIPLQMYGALLVSYTGSNVLSMLAVTAGLTTALAGLSLLLFSLARPMVNYLAMPADPDFSSLPLNQWLRGRGRICFLLLLALIIAGFSLVKSGSITDHVLISFAGLAQLAPGLVATFYFPTINRKGVVAGLVSGLLLWFVGLFLPLFLGEISVSLSPRYAELILGPSNTSSIFFEALFLNVCVCMLVSRLTGTPETERHFALSCMVDNLPEPSREYFKPVTLNDVYKSLSKVFGEEAAAGHINHFRTAANIQLQENRPALLRKFRDQLEATLNALVGTDCSYKIMDKVFPVVSSRDGWGGFIAIDNFLDIAGNKLSGLSGKLDDLRRYHQNVLENMPIGVCIIDEGGEIVSWNKVIAEFSHISAEKAKGCLVSQLSEPWSEVFLDFLNSDEEAKYGVDILINGETVWCNLHKATIQTETTENASNQVLLLEDVSEIVLLSRGLMHSERLASVGRLAAGVAHEIGNPVTGIACLAQDIATEEDSREIVRQARMILDQTQRITDIVQSLTTFSRNGVESARDFSRVNLAQPISEAITLLELRNDRQIQFVCYVPDDVYVTGDPHQLTQVFLNLLTNAFDASPDGGEIEVRVTPEEGQAEIQVIDQGEGVPEEIRKMVFEPFFTTKDVGKGTGLGLSLVYDIVSLHGGEIFIRDSARGNVMVVRLPLAFASHEA